MGHQLIGLLAVPQGPATLAARHPGEAQPRLAVEFEVCRVDPTAHRCGTIKHTAHRLQRVLEFGLPAERFVALMPMPNKDGVVQRASNECDENERLRELLHGLTVSLSGTSA